MDRRVKPVFEQALTAWEHGMSARDAGVQNKLPGDEQARQQQGRGTRQSPTSQGGGGDNVAGRRSARARGRVQSASTSGSGVAGVLRGFVGSWVSAFSTAYRELGDAYEQGKRR
ncbi:hypothetical protein AXK60_02020 [Tsukamurella pseudospumae]|uniref:Uncharacterized protein n=2 Tax=Tsukamurella pseudospumae TaxID=239498 RepID=A0A138AW59_9ACTN|nr:hypothetical protein AXK60_02020 [Tsukamurella pseudospumae]